jgi:outer membrane protein TolC
MDSTTGTLIEGHPRLQARQADLVGAEQAIRSEQLAGRPDFSVMARYGARPLGSDFFSTFVGIRIPLWAGRKQHRLADAARADADAARASLDEERAALAAELERTLAQARAGQTRLGLLANQVLPAAQATVEAALRSYRVGQVDFLNVLTAEDALYHARLEVTETAAEHLTHLVMLEQLVSREAGQ